MPVTDEDAPAIVWFRDDLRLHDQPALAAAAATGRPLHCVYVFDQESPGLRGLGGASRWWLHHSLDALSASLETIGGRLDILRGPAAEIVPKLAAASAASSIFWTRRYGAAEIEIDRAIKAALTLQGLTVESSNGQLLHEPWTVKTKSGASFQTFTPFWRAACALRRQDTLETVAAPKRLQAPMWQSDFPPRHALTDLALLPVTPDWAGGLRETWQPGEAGAQARLRAFLDDGLSGYATDRDRLDRDTSRLSPHLRFGEISPRQVLAAALHARDAERAPAQDVEKFITELGWREFCYHLLFHFPDLASRNFQPRFDDFPWRKPPGELAAWCQGLTGYPIVDAGMRQLWQTGTMHNRVRMVCASFLTKHLLVDWRTGERWFWDTLCDADLANNPANWQWVAGCGADAAPYFRIFNPVLQGEKFDPSGDYVRRYIPELARLPHKWIHKPWQAPPPVLQSAGLALPADYPLPIVDHAKARERALAILPKR
jgi:deoxyribodipyrimidine photo-lyase